VLAVLGGVAAGEHPVEERGVRLVEQRLLLEFEARELRRGRCPCAREPNEAGR
jgi:hypothetical protein